MENRIHTYNEQMEAKFEEINKKIQEINRNQAKNPQTDTSIAEFLQEEYANYREAANKDRESFFNLINTFFVAVGILVTGGIIILHWTFGQTRAEMEDRFQSVRKDIENKYDSELSRLVDSKIEDVKKGQKEINRWIKSQLQLRNSKVVVVSTKNTKKEMSKLIKNRIQNIVEPKVEIIDRNQLDFFKQKFKSKEIDLVIYRYDTDKEEQEVEVRKYINELHKSSRKIPIIIYTGGLKVTGDDLESIESYPLSLMANFPTSLINNISTCQILQNN